MDRLSKKGNPFYFLNEKKATAATIQPTKAINIPIIIGDNKLPQYNIFAVVSNSGTPVASYIPKNDFLA